MGLWVVYTDIFHRLVKNIQIVVAILLALISVFYYQLELNLWGSFWILIVGIILWSFRIVGAGDIKLLGVLSLCVSPDLMLYFLFLMSVIGFVLAFFICIYSAVKNKRASIPYGVAIVISFLFIFISEIANKA